MIEIRLDRGYYHLHHDIGNWCTEQFGPLDMWANHEDVRWYRDMAFGHQHYYFRLEEDATFFKLKWS